MPVRKSREKKMGRKLQGALAAFLYEAYATLSIGPEKPNRPGKRTDAIHVYIPQHFSAPARRFHTHTAVEHSHTCVAS